MEPNLRLAPGQAAASVRRFLCWALLPASCVVAVDWLGAFTSTTYLTNAIAEGMSVALWNVFGCIALSLFGAALLAPRIGMLARAAHQMFNNTFGIGGLNYGLLLGFCIVSAESFSTVQMSVLAAGFLLVTFVNASILYLYWLCSSESQRDGFLAWWRGKPLPFRAPIALLVIVTPIAFLLAES